MTAQERTDLRLACAKVEGVLRRYGAGTTVRLRDDDSAFVSLAARAMGGCISTTLFDALELAMTAERIER